MHDKRNKKLKALIEYLKNQKTINVYGENGPTIATYGSTTMSVLEAIKFSDLNVKVIQPIYLSPLPLWDLKEYEEEEIIVIEQSSTELFANLLKEKAGLRIKTVVKKYDGRPFEPITLAKKIMEVI